MAIEFIEVPYHMGRYDAEVGSGPIRIAATGIAEELGFRRTPVFMAVATTIVAPPVLKVAYQGVVPGERDVKEEAFRLG